jgi:MFS family permease
MIMKQIFEYFYLQIDTKGGWETLDESNSMTGLTDNLSEKTSSISNGKIRIVGASFDKKENAWSYKQLFFAASKEQLNKKAIKSVAETINAKQEKKDGFEKNIEEVDVIKFNTSDVENKSFIPRSAYIVLVVAGLIGALGFGIRGGFGIFLGPISTEFGFGREVFSLSIAIQNLVWGFSQPFVGAFADRFGAFKAIVIGTIFYSAGMFFLSISTTAEALHLSAGLLVGIGLAGTATGIIMPAVAKVFPAEKRSWVLGVVGASSSFGSFAILPIGQHFITTTGWSNTSIIIGIIILIMIPLAMVFVRSTPQKTVELESKSTLRDALSEAFSHPSFWFLCGGFFVCGFHVVFIATHLPSYVVDLGFSATTGAWALAIIGLANVVGGYSAGVLGGKYSKKYLLSGLYFGRSLVMIGFILLPPSELGIYIFAVVMGLFWLSTVPLTSGLVADMYGVRHMSTLFGLVFFSHQLGAFLGGWLGGYFYDSTGSYNIVWWISVVLGIISALAHWPIKPLPQRQLTPAI